jgi:dTDP-4-amino-4,6-dideoxygalactose transaminase
MYFGRIPRFSPSFGLREAAVAARCLLTRPDDEAAVSTFESEFARFVGARHGVMTPSARYAFYLILRGMGLGPGDHVVIPGLTYFAIPAMAVTSGVSPVFADVGLRTHVLDAGAFAAAISPATKAVVPTHLYGTPCDMDAIRAVASERGIRVIEDCAQATGARYRGQRVGHLGDAAYYTFGLTKNMTTLSGAMITTDDDALAGRCRAEVASGKLGPLAKPAKETATGVAMKVATHPLVYPWTLDPVLRLGNRLGKDPLHGRFGEPDVVLPGVPASTRDARPRAAQAAVGTLQLARLDGLNGARARNGQWLDEHLRHVPGVTLPEYPDGSEPIYMSYVVHHPRRTEFMAALRRRGIDTTHGYMDDCSDHPALAAHRRPCANAAAIKRDQVHLPVHPTLDERDLQHLASAVAAAARDVA